jgi:DNA-binding LacI/PurR family transcriptional regulator
MGAVAARLLLDRIKGKKGRAQTIVLPTQLKIRNSVAPPGISTTT